MLRLIYIFCFAVYPVWATPGPNLFSQKALVIDARTSEVLVSRSADTITPIASITKLMTAMVVMDARLPMDELIEINQDDLDYLKGSRSRLRMGASLSRHDLLLVALMSSENRAAHALARVYPGGLSAFVQAMNAKARQLDMRHSVFADPTGLSPNNTSTAEDLVKLVRAAEAYPTIRENSTHHDEQVRLQPGGQSLGFMNSNGLVRNGKWNVHLQKTGYIAEAGNCVVMSLTVAGRKVIVVLLDAAGRYSRFGDAHRIKTWMETGEVLALPDPSKVKRVIRKTRKKATAR
jgi:serine-type D-Ala-D-Ala endopeptidase (penicillin-binding protein 7)